MSRPAALSSRDPTETEAIGAALAVALATGDVIALDGPLGAGKTCLVRGMVRGLGGAAAEVRSPTFVIHQPHRGRVTLHHVDLYRLGPEADLDFLDLDLLVQTGAVVIEWAEYADLTAHHPARIEVVVGGDDERVLRLAVDGSPRLLAAWPAAPVATP